MEHGVSMILLCTMFLYSSNIVFSPNPPKGFVHSGYFTSTQPAVDTELVPCSRGLKYN